MKIIVKYHLSEEGKKKAVAAGLDNFCEQEITFDDQNNIMSDSTIGVRMDNEPDTMFFNLCRRGLMIWENNRKNYYLKDCHYYPLRFSKEEWRDILKNLLRLYGLTRFNVQMGVNLYLDEPITSLDSLRTYEAHEQEIRQKMDDLVLWINEEYVRLNHEIHEQAEESIAGLNIA